VPPAPEVLALEFVFAAVRPEEDLAAAALDEALDPGVDG